MNRKEHNYHYVSVFSFRSERCLSNGLIDFITSFVLQTPLLVALSTSQNVDNVLLISNDAIRSHDVAPLDDFTKKNYLDVHFT